MRNILLVVATVVLFAQVASAQDGTYLKLCVEEAKVRSNVGKEEVRFTLKGTVVLVGDYGSFCRRYNPDWPQGNYVLETYKKRGRKEILSQRFALYSARFTHWDGVDEKGKRTGGVNEMNPGRLTPHFPFDLNDPICAVQIVHGNERTRIELPVEKLNQRFKTLISETEKEKQ